MTNSLRKRAPCTLLLTTLLGLSCVRVARALPSSEFRYLRDEGAAQCPSENELRAAVSARLGYDPFQKGATRTIRASIETMPDGFRARVELEGGQEGPAKREIVTKGSCAELVSAIALSISLAIDAERAGASAEAPAPLTPEAPTTQPGVSAIAPPPDAQPPVAPVTPVTPPQPKREPKRVVRASPEEEPDWSDEPAPRTPARGPHVALPLDFALGSHLQLLSGSAPSTAVGASVFVQGRRDWLSLQLEFRADAPAGTTLPGGGNVDTGVVAFQLVPCAHFEWAKVCALGTLGEIWGTSRGLPTNRTDLAIYSAAGLRVGVEWPSKAIWALSLHGDAMAMISKVQVVVDSTEVWTTPGAYVSLGAGGLVRF